LDCPAGAIATGINAAGGGNVDRIQLICQTVSGINRVFGPAITTGVAGGQGGNAAVIACPAGFPILVGLTGFLGSGGGPFNDQIRGICGAIDGAGTVQTQAAAGSANPGSVPYTATCPVGLALTGIQGGAGGLVDRTQ